MVESAISRNDTTGFLSLSRSTVSCEPDDIIRARCAANRTRSNRLSTLSMQSSTVTRAIVLSLRSMGPNMLLMGVCYRDQPPFAGPIYDSPARSALLTCPGLASRSVLRLHKQRFGQENASVHVA